MTLKSYGPGRALPPGARQPDVATSVIARALADAFRDTVDDPIPAKLLTLLRRIEAREAAQEVAARSPQPIVLIVDHDSRDRELASALLNETSLAVVELRSAEAALAFLQDHGGETAMVFANAGPAGGMDALRFAKAVGTLWPTIRVVVSSDRDLDRSEDWPSSVFFVSKPWRGLDMLDQAEKALHERLPPVL